MHPAGKALIRSRPRRWYLALLPVVLLSCARTTASTSPEVHTPSTTALLQHFQERTQQVHTLTALVAVSYRFGERQGTFDLAVNYAAPGQLRFTALKDALLSTQVLFDLVLLGRQYRLQTQDHAATQQGLVRELIEANPAMRAFAILGEAFFLPGLYAPESAVQFHARGFRNQLPNGAIATWTVDPAAMEITQGRLQWPTASSSMLVRYQSYRQVGGITLPQQVMIEDRQVRFQADSVLKEIDLNMPLPADIFQLPASTL